MRAVVTGGSSGIGAAIRRALDKRDIMSFDLSRTSGNDVTSSLTVLSAYEEMGRPTPELLVAAAGIIDPIDFLEVPVESWRRVLDVNVTGTFLVAQEHARRLIQEERPGRIMLFGSPSGRRPSMGNLAYGVSKAAVEALGIGLARGLEEHDIKVYTICPSHVDTPMMRSRGFDLTDTPMLDADLFAEEMVHLLLDNSYLDGQRLYVSTMVMAKQQ